MYKKIINKEIIKNQDSFNKQTFGLNQEKEYFSIINQNIYFY